MKLKAYKLNIISRCLTSLKSPKSAVTMNHSQQLEPSLGKRTELICSPNISFNLIFSLSCTTFKIFQKLKNY